jgi:uncharacterized membrane protein YqjE
MPQKAPTLLYLAFLRLAEEAVSLLKAELMVTITEVPAAVALMLLVRVLVLQGKVIQVVMEHRTQPWLDILAEAAEAQVK